MVSVSSCVGRVCGGLAWILPHDTPRHLLLSWSCQGSWGPSGPPGLPRWPGMFPSRERALLCCEWGLRKSRGHSEVPLGSLASPSMTGCPASPGSGPWDVPSPQVSTGQGEPLQTGPGSVQKMPVPIPYLAGPGRELRAQLCQGGHWIGGLLSRSLPGRRRCFWFRTPGLVQSLPSPVRVPFLPH